MQFLEKSSKSKSYAGKVGEIDVRLQKYIFLACYKDGGL
jgi:hypothetical protein